MKPRPRPGQIVILNGVPRSGKSSIAGVVQTTFDGVWMNLGGDVFKEQIAPPQFGPGLGLRPGAGRADLEHVVPAYFLALYDSIAAHSRQGLCVVTDIGHHEGYTSRLNLLSRCARRLEGLPVLFVGVRCPVDVIMARRNAGQPGREGIYATSRPGEAVPRSVLQWQEAVHEPGLDDLEVDTSVMSAEDCAEAIAVWLASGREPTAFAQLARR